LISDFLFSVGSFSLFMDCSRYPIFPMRCFLGSCILYNICHITYIRCQLYATSNNSWSDRYYTADEAEEGPDVNENNQESMEVVADGKSDAVDPSDDDEEYNESVDRDSDIMDESM
jgi:hypothetical protein